MIFLYLEMKEGKKIPLSCFWNERGECHECMAVCELYVPCSCLFEHVAIIWSQNYEKAQK